MDLIQKRRNFIIDVVYATLIIGLFYLFFKYAFGMCLPFIIAVFIAVLLQKPVNAIMKKTHNRFRGFFSALLAVFCFVVVGSVVIALIVKLFNEFKDFGRYLLDKMQDAPLFISQVQTWINTKLTVLPEAIRTSMSSYVGDTLSNILGTAQESAEVTVQTKQAVDFSWLASPIGAVWGTAKQIPIIAVGILVAIVSCCFMTSDYTSLKGIVLKLAGEKNAVKIIAAKRILFSTVSKLIKAYAILILITFTEMVIGLSLLKLFGLYNNGYIFIIALITAIVDIFPVLGTGTILIPWGLWSLLTGNIGLGIGLIVLYVIITVIRQTVEPKLVASQLGLPPFVTLIAMYLGTQLFGVIGLFLLPISIMLVKVLNDEGVIRVFKNDEVNDSRIEEEVEEEINEKLKPEQEKTK
ncbi:MAG: sporulation integral membrane protein YtvI [Ruminococcaceae bacterium]|nr:sporulation integral membrane protein YtvI [Oscillospiraceae bacterium]